MTVTLRPDAAARSATVSPKNPVPTTRRSNPSTPFSIVSARRSDRRRACAVRPRVHAKDSTRLATAPAAPIATIAALPGQYLPRRDRTSSPGRKWRGTFAGSSPWRHSSSGCSTACPWCSTLPRRARCGRTGSLMFMRGQGQERARLDPRRPGCVPRGAGLRSTATWAPDRPRRSPNTTPMGPEGPLPPPVRRNDRHPGSDVRLAGGTLAAIGEGYPSRACASDRTHRGDAA